MSSRGRKQSNRLLLNLILELFLEVFEQVVGVPQELCSHSVPLGVVRLCTCPLDFIVELFGR